MPLSDIAPERLDLYELDLEEVSFVDAGDNPGAHILLYKAKGQDVPGLAPVVRDGEMHLPPSIAKLSDGAQRVWREEFGKSQNAWRALEAVRKSGYALVPAELIKRGEHAEPALVQELVNEVAGAGTPSDSPQQTDPTTAPGGGADSEGVSKWREAVRKVAAQLGMAEAQVAKADEWTPPDFDELQRSKARMYIEEELASMVGSFLDASMMALGPEGDVQQRLNRSLQQFTDAVQAAIPQWAAGKTVMAKEADLGTERKGRLAQAIKNAGEALTADPAERTEGGNTVAVNRDDLAPEVRAEIEAAEARANTAEQTLQTLQGGGGPTTAATSAPAAAQGAQAAADATNPVAMAAARDELFKGINPELRKYIEGLEARTVAAEGATAGLVKQTEDAEYIAKAREQGLAEPEKVGPAMRRLDKNMAQEGDFKIVQDAWAAKAAQGNVTGLFGQIGKTAGQGGGAATAAGNVLQKHASAVVNLKKEHPDKSDAQLRQMAWEQNPELRDEYRREQGYLEHTG